MDEPIAKPCSVCGKNPIAGVCCVPGVPYSCGYCDECLRANAHPWGILVANTALLGGLDKAAPWWIQMVNATCKRLGRSMQDFNKDVQAAIDAETPGDPVAP